MAIAIQIPTKKICNCDACCYMMLHDATLPDAIWCLMTLGTSEIFNLMKRMKLAEECVFTEPRNSIGKCCMEASKRCKHAYSRIMDGPFHKCILCIHAHVSILTRTLYVYKCKNICIHLKYTYIYSSAKITQHVWQLQSSQTPCAFNTFTRLRECHQICFIFAAWFERFNRDEDAFRQETCVNLTQSDIQQYPACLLIFTGVVIFCL